MTHIFLADDHAIVRDGIRSLIASEPGLQVVGEASNGQELLDRLPSTPADVVLLDVNMPILDGLATTHRLRAEFPDIKVLILTMLNHERYIGQLFDAGAHGYILKSADKGEIIAAIQAVASGKQFLCSDLGLAMLHKVLTRDRDYSSEEPEAKKPGQLTRREKEILHLLAEGLTTSEMAEKLFTSKRTVESHRQSLLEKTGALNTPALVKYAMEQGWLQQ